ncbi:hypothetical protein FXO38_15390 [Capsicum annuum]|nr:hypothetical protein FXO37_25811 [Capsicum annuum]KAF3653961.1 hypothetical protein FXO38_15390 [Capsicum annuum]
MEYVEHDLKSLSEKMKHPSSQTEIKFLMIQLLEGVRYLHDNWIMHRDLKPSNLLVNDKGKLKIGDFGQARRRQNFCWVGGDNATRPQSTCGHWDV